MLVSPRLDKHVQRIVDVFSGGDGGAAFVAFRGLMADMSSRAEKGDKPAEEICQVVERFSRLLAVSSKTMGLPPDLGDGQ